MSETYEICEGHSPTGTPWWAVVAFNDLGQPLGADHHWLTPGFAEHAMTLYQRGLVAHGELPELVQVIFDQLVEANAVQG